MCEEAGCPNIYECWSQRTATFMILGDRCTRACGFCLVDTRQPFPIDPDEPGRVAEAVATLGLAHAVVTSVARDDVADGGAAGFVATIDAIRRPQPRDDDRGADPGLQGRRRRARRDLRGPSRRAEPQPRDGGPPAATRAPVGRRTPARSACSARAKDAGPRREVGHHPRARRGHRRGARPRSPTCVPSASTSSPSASTSDRRPRTCRWRAGSRRRSSPSSATYARSLGFAHVESGPLVRSSYHARDGATVALAPA